MMSPPEGRVGHFSDFFSQQKSDARSASTGPCVASLQAIAQFLNYNCQQAAWVLLVV
jgi:predicted nucleic acid-binding Zn ribbon protein